MNSLIVNEELTMNVPEGFHIMTEEEMAQLKYFDKPMWLIMDPDRHKSPALQADSFPAEL